MDVPAERVQTLKGRIACAWRVISSRRRGRRVRRGASIGGDQLRRRVDAREVLFQEACTLTRLATRHPPATMAATISSWG